MTAADVMAELETLGSEQTRKTFRRHGAVGRVFGVKVGDLKVIQKRLRVNHPLALELYATGVSDAMYLAGLIADPKAMTKADLNRWVKAAPWSMIGDFTVPWVAAESRHAAELAVAWMGSWSPSVRSSGWATYASFVAVTPDAELDLDEVAGLLGRVKRDLHAEAADRVRYAMNGFVIAVGGYVGPLRDLALAAAAAVGPVSVDMGDTDCKVPDAAAYIRKATAGGPVKKRKTAKC